MLFMISSASAKDEDFLQRSIIRFEASEMVAVNMAEKAGKRGRKPRKSTKVIHCVQITSGEGLFLEYSNEQRAMSNAQRAVRKDRPLMSGNSDTMPLNVDMAELSQHGYGST